MSSNPNFAVYQWENEFTSLFPGFLIYKKELVMESLMGLLEVKKTFRTVPNA